MYEVSLLYLKRYLTYGPETNCWRPPARPPARPPHIRLRAEFCNSANKKYVLSICASVPLKHLPRKVQHLKKYTFFNRNIIYIYSSRHELGHRLRHTFIRKMCNIFVTKTQGCIVLNPIVQSNYESTSRKLQHKLWLRIWKAKYMLFQIKKCLPKSTPWKVVIFGIKVAILMKNRPKLENLRYTIVSYLYIAILLLFRGIRYYISTKNCLPKSTPWKVVIFGVKVGILMKNH